MTIEEKPVVVLADGTRLEESQCGYANHHLWCYVKGLSFQEVFAVFSDPEKTIDIRFRYGTQEEVYIGFTEVDIIKRSEFTIDVRLIGGTKLTEEDTAQESDENVRDGSET